MATRLEKTNRRSRRVTLGALVLLVGLLPGAAGCLFTPRQAEPPVAGDVVSYNPQTSARNVWDNVELALNSTDPGGWDQNLSPDFRYFPDTETESTYPSIDWANWDKTAEMSFIQAWFGSSITVLSDMVLPGSENTNDPSGDSGEWDLIYYIRVTDEFGGETRYSGRALIGFQLEGNFWYISYWRDLNGEEDPESPGSNLQTMGVVRGAVASQK
jgi:hypothetical protein